MENEKHNQEQDQAMATPMQQWELYSALNRECAALPDLEVSRQVNPSKIKGFEW